MDRYKRLVAEFFSWLCCVLLGWHVSLASAPLSQRDDIAALRQRDDMAALSPQDDMALMNQHGSFQLS